MSRICAKLEMLIFVVIVDLLSVMIPSGRLNFLAYAVNCVVIFCLTWQGLCPFSYQNQICHKTSLPYYDPCQVFGHGILCLWRLSYICCKVSKIQ